jgi:hypothetical protein
MSETTQLVISLKAYHKTYPIRQNWGSLGKTVVGPRIWGLWDLCYKDLPDSYGTQLVSAGARHSLTDDVQLGPTILDETDGTPAVYADFDADDDGATPLGNWSDGTGDAEVIVSGSEPGCLSVWVDYTGTVGIFDGSDLVLDRFAVSAGTVPIFFPLPANVADNASLYTRFRVIPDTDKDGLCSDEVAITPIWDTITAIPEDPE